ncbi:MAG: anti-sigma factor antagonist [Coriobacteriales bacterium]|nr:anti-sigma factor antagonist [Coriobacteriales bacterium]
MSFSHYNVMSIPTPDGLLMQVSGRITAENAPQLEEDINQIRAEAPDAPIIIDADDLEYISSAGLRVVMRLLKSSGNLTLRNAHPEVYDVFEMTGLTEIMDVRRAPRTISVDGLEVVGRGGQGTVYRLDEDKVVKLYDNNFSLDAIERERRYARTALVAGISTALPYDTVRCGDKLGVVFEHAGEQTLARAYEQNPQQFNELTQRYVQFVRDFHAAEVPAGTFKSVSAKSHRYLDGLASYCSPEEIYLLHSLADAIPQCATLVHGDLHPGNIMVSGDELLLIDMPDISQGPTQIDIVNIFRDIVSAPQNSPEAIEVSMGIPADLIKKIGGAFFSTYTGITDPAQLGQYFQGLGLIYALLVVFVVGSGGMGTAYIPRVVENLLRGVVIPNEQALRGMLANMQ